MLLPAGTGGHGSEGGTATDTAGRSGTPRQEGGTVTALADMPLVMTTKMKTEN